jgi:hypothetical protein
LVNKGKKSSSIFRVLFREGYKGMIFRYKYIEKDWVFGKHADANDFGIGVTDCFYFTGIEFCNIALCFAIDGEGNVVPPSLSLEEFSRQISFHEPEDI